MAILYPTSLANLVVEVGTRHSHQTVLLSYFPMVVCVRRLYHHIIEHIVSQWWYSLVCTLHYLIVIMPLYLKVLNFLSACQVHPVECVSNIKPIISISYPVMIVRIRVPYLIIIIKSQVWTMAIVYGCLWKMVCTVCLSTNLWWRHDMETLSASPTLCGENPPVICGYP